MRARQTRDERGAIAVITGVVVSTVLLAVSAFAIDLGMQRSARRDMQALADIVALDLARLVDGRTRQAIEDGYGSVRPGLAAATAASVANNDGNTLGEGEGCDGSCVDVYLVQVDELGVFPLDTAGLPAQVAPTEVPNGVVVIANTTVGFSFGLLPDGSATRRAVATGIAGGVPPGSPPGTPAPSSATACFSVGSYAGRLDTADSALLHGVIGGVLGGNLGVDLVSYRGLADAEVSLQDLATELNVGSVEQLASARVGLGALLVAAADVLERDGNAADAVVLDAIAARVGALPDIDIAGLVGLQSGGGAAETATINAFSLVTGGVLLANGTNALAIPGLAASLGLTGTGFSSSLGVIQNAQVGCGRAGLATARTSQVDLTASGTLLSTPSVLGLTVTAGDTDVDLDIASAEGRLSQIICGEPPSMPEGIDVDVTSGLVGVTVDQTLTVNGSLTGGALTAILPGVDSLLRVEVTGQVVLTGGTSAPDDTRTASIRVPPQQFFEPVSTGTGSLGIDTTRVTVNTSALQVRATLLGLSVPLTLTQVTAITDALVSGLTTDIVSPLLGRVNSALLLPLTAALGVTYAGADVMALPRPSCGEPRLVG